MTSEEARLIAEILGEDLSKQQPPQDAGDPNPDPVEIEESVALSA